MAKYFLCLLVVCTLTKNSIQANIPDELKEAAAQLRSVCLGESGTTNDLVEATNGGSFAEDNNLKCYFKCVYEKLGALEGDKVVPETIIDMLPPELSAKVAGAIKGCGSVSGADICDTAFKTNKCYYEKDPSNYFSI